MAWRAGGEEGKSCAVIGGGYGAIWGCYGLANTAAVIDIGPAGIGVGYTMLKLGWKYFLDIIGYAREIGDDEGK